MGIPVVTQTEGWVPFAPGSGVYPTIVDGNGRILPGGSYWGTITTQVGTGLDFWSWTGDEGGRVVFGVYPMVLPARNPMYSLTVATAKAGDYGLKIGLVWWTIGIILAAGYSTYVYRSFAGKVVVGKDSHGYGD
jgi:Cytochrome oxidase subunit II.